MPGIYTDAIQVEAIEVVAEVTVPSRAPGQFGRLQEHAEGIVATGVMRAQRPLQGVDESG